MEVIVFEIQETIIIVYAMLLTAVTIYLLTKFFRERGKNRILEHRFSILATSLRLISTAKHYSADDTEALAWAMHIAEETHTVLIDDETPRRTQLKSE